MNKNIEEVLLYCFQAERSLVIQTILQAMKIKIINISSDAAGEKVGFLLGLKGFGAAKTALSGEPFAHELLIFHNISRARLDKILAAFHKAAIGKIQYKSMVTPYNVFWTIQRLGETMQKEHGIMLQQTAGKGGDEA